jgi:hypothetical protein
LATVLYQHHGRTRELLTIAELLTNVIAILAFIVVLDALAIGVLFSCILTAYAVWTVFGAHAASLTIMPGSLECVVGR